VAAGITPKGKRQVLGVSVSLSEHETHRKAFLKSLKERGLNGMKLIISNDHEGLGAAGRAVFGSDAGFTCNKKRRLIYLNRSCEQKWQRNSSHVQSTGPNRRGIPSSRIYPEICSFGPTLVCPDGGEPGRRIHSL